MAETILKVEDLSVSFRMYDRGLEQYDLKVINNLSVSVKQGEVVAVAGASGSGKSLLAHAILGILPGNASVSGRMEYNGETLIPSLQEKLRGRNIALVPQSVSYLDPLMRVGRQVVGSHGSEEKRQALFSRYHLDEKVARYFPFQLSGGMARRILLSTAIMRGDYGSAEQDKEKKLIIADEPTPGLSANIAALAMGHFRELARDGAGVLLITHDIDLAFEYADRIAVFYSGSTVEIAPVEDFKIKAPEEPRNLRHPYSKALWQAVPQNGFIPLPGNQPYAGSLPAGCAFGKRCPHKTFDCEKPVPMRELRGGEVRCIHAV
jgi:peptide/nickel transport system ATP-binding protein